MPASSAEPWARDHVADANPGLPRKRERLSEGPESSPRATADAVAIEAVPPEEAAGNSYDTAIELHDGLDMASLRGSFELEPSSDRTPVQQLALLTQSIIAGRPCDPLHIYRLSVWVEEHVSSTRASGGSWHEAYLGDHEFFSTLGQVCYSILDHPGDLFNPKAVAAADVPTLGLAITNFLPAVTELSIRILASLPNELDTVMARRDSGQAPKVRQRADLLCYMQILAQTMLHYRAGSMDYLRNVLHVKPHRSVKEQKVRFASSPRAMRDLVSVLGKLAQSHRDISNAWEGIDAALRIIRAFELPDDINELEQIMNVTNDLILPVICEKHPRALPDGFHELLISISEKLMRELVGRTDTEGASSIYERYVQSDHDALLPESATGISTAILLDDVSAGSRDMLMQLLAVAWSLQALKSFIYSDIMDVRSCGILQLSHRLVSLFKEHQAARDKLDYPVLSYVGRFMRSNELTKYIFGPSSHASLVSHSQNIIGFLAATLAYTDLDTDIIWHACTNSVEAEFVKASFAVLVDLCRYLDLEHLLYIVHKYVETPPSKLGKDAAESLTDLFQKVQIKNGQSTDDQYRLATAFISMEIMMRVDNAEANVSLTRLREIAKNELLRFSAPSYDAQDRLQLYMRCAPEIVKSTSNATTSVDILGSFLRNEVSRHESKQLLDLLSVQAVVDELGRFVQALPNAAEVGSFNLSAIELRLDLIVRLMASSSARLDDNVIFAFFSFAVGERAANNIARDCAWRALVMMSNLEGISEVASDLVRRFMDNEITTFPLQYFTTQLVKLCGSNLQHHAATQTLQDNYSLVLDCPIWQKLVHLAESTCVPATRQQATKIICKTLFEIPSHSGSRASVLDCHAHFTRSQIARICSEFPPSTDQRNDSTCQKLSLLDAVLSESRRAAALFANDVDLEICLESQSQDKLLQYTLQIHSGGQTPPKVIKLLALPSNKISELLEKLPTMTGAAENRIIVGGREVDLTSEAVTSFAEAGIPASGVISICPKHTPESDLGTVFPSPGSVEHEVLEHYEELERLLDGPDDVANKAYIFLIKVRLSSETRRRVASPETPVRVLCPLQGKWRSAFSFHILKTNLTDFARIGVADEVFIVRGLRLLIAVITDPERDIQLDIMIWALDCLLLFLLEQPQPSTTGVPIEDPAQFASRMIEICLFALHSTPAPETNNFERETLADLTFRALLQAFRRQPSVWQCFIAHPQVAQVHELALFDSNLAFAQHAAGTMLDFCNDKTAANGVADFYLNIILDLLPRAPCYMDHAVHFFHLATRIMSANKLLRSDEARTREITNSLIATMWQYKHIESVDLPVVDASMAGLLTLVTQAVEILKDFKTPLRLENFAAEFLGALLFPPWIDRSSRPLIYPETRDHGFNLVHATCETRQDFHSLLDGTLRPLLDADDNTNQKYHGPSHWLRPATTCSGLPNLGMTCYMNSLLQQLFANVQFRKFIFEVPVHNVDKQNLLYSVQMLFAEMQDSYNLPPDTTELARVLDIQTDSQEDVHGFYGDFLSKLEAAMPDAAWRKGLASFFTGKLITQIKGECGHVSPRTEPFVDLPVIVSNKTCLSESLDEFVQGEPMEGANKYKCLACDPTDGGRLVDAMRRACLEEIPDNLTFCLKRFSFDTIYGMDNKLNDRFEFPREVDMATYQRRNLENNDEKHEPDIFELVGVIVHQGTLNLGHYWSYTLLRNTLPGDARKWVKLEDKNVSLVEDGIQEVQRECFGGLKYTDGSDRADNAYVLFYQRLTSLEEQVAVPGPVVDAATQALLPPKVPIPPSQVETIHNHNAWSYRIAHIFEETLYSHVHWLLCNYPHYNQEDASVDSEQSPTDDVDMVCSPAEVKNFRALAQTSAKMSKVVMTYLKRIASCDRTISSKLTSCIHTLVALGSSQTGFAVKILQEIADDSLWYSGILQHPDQDVTERLNSLVHACLSQVRLQDLSAFDHIHKQLIQIRASLILALRKPQLLEWDSFLKFASDFASQGPRETAVVLDSGFWTWTLQIINLPYDANAQRGFPGLLEHIRCNPQKVSGLYRFVYSILDGHVDNRDHSQTTMPGEPRFITESAVCLTNDELVELLQKNESGNGNGAYWWLRTAKFAEKDSDWRSFAPGKLLGVLISTETDVRVSNLITNALSEHIDKEEHSLVTLLYLVSHFYQNCDRAQPGAGQIFNRLANVIKMWEGSEVEFIQTVREVYMLAPEVVLANTDQWLTSFLQSKQAHVRNETSKWLLDSLFASDPIAGPPEVDCARAHLARKLVSHCSMQIENAFSAAISRKRYESMVQLVSGIEKYLIALKEGAAAAAVGTQLQHEINEVDATVKVARRLDTEILKNWSDDDNAANDSLDVRRSVELDDDPAGSEEWDEEEDDSVVETAH